MGPLIGVLGENGLPENPGVSFRRYGCARKRQKEEAERAEKKLAKERKALKAKRKEHVAQQRKAPAAL